MVAGWLTLHLASGGNISLLVDLDLRTGPGAIEVSLDNHVGRCLVEKSSVEKGSGWWSVEVG